MSTTSIGARGEVRISIDIVTCIKLLEGKMLERDIVLQLMAPKRRRERE